MPRPRPWHVRPDETAPSVLIYDADGKYVAEVGRDMWGATAALETAQEIVDVVNAAHLLETAARLLDAEAPKVEMRHHSEPGPGFDYTSPAGMMMAGGGMTVNNNNTFNNTAAGGLDVEMMAMRVAAYLAGGNDA